MTALLPDLADCLRIQLYTLLTAAALLCLHGCGSPHYEEYVEPPDADAQLVVHPEWGDTYDVFLDGKRLGRISWVQAYNISAGQHVFGVNLVRRLKGGGKTTDYIFTVGPGETLHLAVVRWGEYGPGPIPGTEELKAGGVRISEIHP